jgi:hypothetical protein
MKDISRSQFLKTPLAGIVLMPGAAASGQIK